MADVVGEGSGGSMGADTQAMCGTQHYTWQTTDGNCLDLLAKQFRMQSMPEFVQVTGEETVVENAQVLGTLTAGEGLLVEGSIIGAFEDSPAVEGLRTVSASDFPKDLAQGAQTNAIIYLQPDGTLVEGGGGGGLGAEEEYGLVEQLVEMPEQRGPRLLKTQSSHFIQHAALAPEELQQVIEQVTKSHEQQQSREKRAVASGKAESSGPCAAPCSASTAVAVVQNAAQQLQNVAQQVALEQNKIGSATRLLQPKHLEAIRIQVQPKENKEKPMPPLATIQPQIVKLNQSLNGNSAASKLNILGPQIIRIQPVTGSGEQQFLLHSSSDPSFQLLVQRPLPPLRLVSKKKAIGKILNGQKKYPMVSAASPENITAVPSKPPTTGPEHKSKDKLKVKKSLKIKTRSGRISRPPKYKARDYKFIKTEDLVDGRLSDSDDYSELSVEEEDEGKQEGALFSPLSYNLKPKTFKCEVCEKSYIGKGGLARHYKLNPGHGKLDSSQQKPMPGNKLNGLVSSGDVGEANDDIVRLMLPELSVTDVVKNESVSSPPALEVTVGAQNGQETSKLTEDERLLEPMQQTESSDWSFQMPEGPGQFQGTKCGRLVVSGRRRRGRPGRPSKSLTTVSAEHHRLRRKGRLKELLHQCSSEDVMEVALPYLTKLVTVYEFLLMKVEKGYPAKAFFPDVYKEFEELHSLVKIMAQDYFNNPALQSSQQMLEIKNPKVAETLGITEKFPRKQKLNEGFSQKYLSDKQPLFETEEHKCAKEGTNEELEPPMKRIRRETIAESTSLIYAGDNGMEEEMAPPGMPPTKGGFNCQLDAAAERCMLGMVSDIGMECIDSKLPQAYGEFTEPEGRTDSSESDILLHESSGETKDLSEVASVSLQSQDKVSNTSYQDAEFLTGTDNSSDTCDEHFTNEKSLSRLKKYEFSSPMSEIDSQSTCLINSERDHIAVSMQVPQHDAHLQDSLIHHDHSEQLNDSDIADQMQELERVFSEDVSTDPLYRTQAEPPLPTIHDDALSTQVSFATEMDNLTELSYEIEDQPHGHHELESAITVDGTVAFEITDESHQLLTQGHEQIFIHTSDGLILSHPSAAVSQTEGIVIVTNSDGTTMHIRAHEGVPLETVEALLTMEAEGQSESILVSQSTMEQ